MLLRVRNWLAALMLAFAVACAEQQPPRGDPALDPLFEQLRAAPNAAAAAQIEARIWEAWEDSGSPTVDVLLDRAEAAEVRGDTGAARRFLDEATDLLPEYAEAYNRRAVLAFGAQDFQAALSDINETLAREPRHFGALTGLGVIYESLGQDAAALKAYREALAIHPHFEQARQGEARLKLRVEGQAI